MRFTPLVTAGLALGLMVATDSLQAATLADSAAKQKNMLAGLREALEMKASATPAETKLGTELMLSERARTGKAAPLGSAAKLAPRGVTHGIYKVIGAPTDDLKLTIESLGGKMGTTSRQGDAMTVALPEGALMTLAGHPDVTSIRATRRAIPQQVVTAGAVAHKVDQLAPARTGAGVVIGVISERVSPVEMQSLVTNGDLPADVSNQLYAIDWRNTTPAADRESQSASWNGATTGAWADAANGSNDGLAMLEVLHDIAPGATLLFTSYNDEGVVGMEAAIEALANPAAGTEYPAADIIVDDLFFFDQSPFQDDVIARAANTAVTGNTGMGIDPVVYVTAAGDFGNDAANTASTYEADFLPTTPVNNCDAQDAACNADFDFFFGASAYQAHDFGGDVASVAITEDLSELCLFWSEPLDGATSDYDLFAFNASGQWIDVGNNFVGNASEPKECIGNDANLVAGTTIVVASVSAGSSDRFLHLSGLPLALEQAGTAPTSDAFAVTTAGAIRGQAGSSQVLAVGAANVQQDMGSPRAFLPSDASASYSSDGFRRVFFDATGNPLTAGNFLAAGGQVRQKPDIVAADGIALVLPGADSNLVSSTFFGTSASAAHAAGLVALMIEAEPTAVPGDLLAAIRAGAVDFGPAGVDINAGHGAADVVAALTAVADPGPARNVIVTPGVASASLNFDRPVDDYLADFSFTAVCSQTVDGGAPFELFNGAVTFASLPLQFGATPGALTSCAVTSASGANTGPAVDSGAVFAEAIGAPQNLAVNTTVTAGFEAVFASSANDIGNLEYNLTCSETAGAGDAGGSEIVNALRAPGTYVEQANPGFFVDCTVTPQVVINGVTTTGTAATVENAQVQAAVAATLATFTPDLGGLTVSYTTDPAIADSDMFSVLLSCTASGQPVPELTNVDLTALGNPAFVDAEADVPLSCTVSTSLTVNGVLSSVMIDDVVGSVTAEPGQTGLPIWLIFQASQPASP